MNLNLFSDELQEFDPTSCLKKIVTVKYVCDLEILHKQIKDLTYHGLINFRSSFIAYLIESQVYDSKSACEKFWERNIKEVELQFNYVYPKSMREDAVRK